MRSMFRSTFGVAALISVLLTAATLAIGGFAYHVTHEALEAQLDNRVETEVRALLSESGASRIENLAVAIRRREAAGEAAHLGYILIDRDGRRLAGSLEAEVPDQLGYDEFIRQTDGGSSQGLVVAVPGGRLIVAADRTEIDEIDRELFTMFAGALGGLLLLGMAGAWTLGVVARTRLARIDQAALAIIGGDLSRRIPLDGSGSEFDQVAETLNRMLDKIDDLLTSIRQVSADVAHDLRTPLTRLRNRLEDAQTADDPDDRKACVAVALTQSDELLEIFAALLRISEIEAMRPNSNFRMVDLAQLAAELVEAYRPDAEASGHRLILPEGAVAAVMGDRRLLQQLISNLLDNALRHTPQGTAIWVEATKTGGSITLVVRDDGPGANQADADRLFTRFARGEHSRSTDGNGLGLALVRAIARAHRGDARISGTDGFAIFVTLPACPT